MVGRAARGNPWIFREISAFLETGKSLPGPGAEEIKQTILCHAQRLLEAKGEYTAVREMRKHVAWYTAGYPNSAALRRRVNEMESFEELLQAVEDIFRE